MARVFLDWLAGKRSGHWLDVGCGTGALSAAICALCEPASVVGCDPAEPFVAHARSQVVDPRVSFVVAGVDALPGRDHGFDTIVSGLVLNFLPEPERAVTAMRERLTPGGLVAAYVWDYADGLEFLRAFWDEATASDPGASALDEGGRFPLCQAAALGALFRAAGLTSVDTIALEVPTRFVSFDDLWAPFLGGTGPAPRYVASLDPTARATLKERLRRRLLPSDGEGSIDLRARAWAVRGRAL
jgi:SAM-dependent methyltransferase